ncbi:MAG: alpha/beta fold hydrolase [Kineosporiaceae bacterium]
MPTRHGHINVRIWDGPPDESRRALLVCLHGLADSGEVFGRLWEALGAWTVIAPDAPGHGNSSWPSGERYGAALCAEAMAEVLDWVASQYPSRPVLLLGHSTGALAAALVAAARPALVRHVIVEEPPRRPWRPRVANAKERIWTQRIQAFDEQACSVLASWGWSEEDNLAWLHSKREFNLAVFDDGLIWGPRLRDVLPHVQVPVTAVLGRLRRGSTIRPWTVRRHRRACPAGYTCVRLDAGHNPRREAFDDYTATVRSVLLSVEPWTLTDAGGDRP